MRPTIPSNTYPLEPSTTVAYWQALEAPGRLKMDITGKVPMWVGFHDGGGGKRKLTVLLVRIRPDLEIVLVSGFRTDLAWERTERAIKKRLTKPNWPDRSWYLSHIAYMATPPKNRPTTARRERGRPWFARFCAGQLRTGRDRRLMLAFVPLRRLKLVANPGQKDNPAGADVVFELDPSKNQRKNVVRFVTALMELERWEQQLAHLALGHLLGPDYLSPLSQTAERFTKATGSTANAIASRAFREGLTSPPEAFRMPRWIRAPEHAGIRRAMTTAMFQIRFPLAYGPDPEFSVRPWLPESLRDIIVLDCPIQPAVDMVTSLTPMPKEHAVGFETIVGALAPYAPP